MQRISFFWAQGEAAAPDIVKRCWAAWARLNPGWQIEIFDASDAQSAFARIGLRHPPKTFQGMADVFRVQDLCDHGGLYVDAATVPLVPLDSWLPRLTETGFFAFHDPYRQRPIENWLIYSAPGHPLASKWRDHMLAYFDRPRRIQAHIRELDKGWKGALAAGLTSLRKAPKAKRVLEPRDRLWSVSPMGGAARPIHPYFWPHYLFDLLLKSDPEARGAWAKVPKEPSYKHLMLRHWKKRYADMTQTEFDSLVKGAVTQKLALNTPPPGWMLDQLLPR